MKMAKYIFEHPGFYLDGIEVWVVEVPQEPQHAWPQHLNKGFIYHYSVMLTYSYYITIK